MSRHIGNIIEQYARDTFNLIPMAYNSYADAMLMNIPIEIKGVLMHPNDERNKNGRVWITNKNHARLLKNGGMYLFVVYEYKKDVFEILDYIDIDICHVTFMAAHRIKVNSGKNTKISYKKLIDGL
jgi:hypothetical protein